MGKSTQPRGHCPHHPDRAVVAGLRVCDECHRRWMQWQRRSAKQIENHNAVDNYLRHVVEQESLPAYLRTAYEGAR